MSASPRVFVPAAALCVVASTACQPVSWTEEEEGPYMEEGVFPDDDSGPDDGGPNDSGDDGGPDGGEIDDVPVGGTDTAGDGCHLVDILFVVDNSNSMQGEQSSLAASVPGFLTGIDEYLGEENDVRIGVVSTDVYQHNPEACRAIGALVTSTPEGLCGPYSEGNFMTAADDLGTTFPCAAKVGIDGDHDEHPAEAAITALHPDTNAEGACNAGFIRDDALLVLVVITDEDDEDGPIPEHTGSPGTPTTWFDQIVAHKGGIESNIVVLGLVGIQAPNECDASEPFEGASYAPRLIDFVERFTYGTLGDVCVDDYSPFLADSLEVIFQACQDFEPVG